MDIETVSTVVGVFGSGFGLGWASGWVIGKSRTTTTMPQDCSVFVQMVINLANKTGKQMQSKPINVEAIAGKPTRCDCRFCDPVLKTCMANENKKCIFFNHTTSLEIILSRVKTLLQKEKKAQP